MKSTFSIILIALFMVDYIIAYDGYGGHAIDAAILTTHTVHSIPYNSDGGNGRTTRVNINGGVAPIEMHFRTRSSPIKMLHSHINHGGSYGQSSSYDGTHSRVHTVYKPVINVLKEVIQPKKVHLQVVRPVKSLINTNIFGHFGFGH